MRLPPLGQRALPAGLALLLALGACALAAGCERPISACIASKISRWRVR